MRARKLIGLSFVFLSFFLPRTLRVFSLAMAILLYDKALLYYVVGYYALTTPEVVMVYMYPVDVNGIAKSVALMTGEEPDREAIQALEVIWPYAPVMAQLVVILEDLAITLLIVYFLKRKAEKRGLLAYGV